MADEDDTVQKGFVVYDALKGDELNGRINDGPNPEAAKAGVFGGLEDVELEKGFIADRLNVGERPKGLDFVMEPPKPILPTD